MKTTLAFLTIFFLSAPSYAVQCYRWFNNTNQQVALTFYYLDGSFNPNGQTSSHIINAHESYPISDDNCWGLNVYGLAKVKNGKPNWDVENTIFGTAPSGAYQINTN